MERFCSPNEFDQLVELVECGDGTDSLELVSWCVPLVFDATRSIDAQIEQADRILRQWKNKLLKDDRIKRARGMSEKRTLWIRHLRVLDALRTIPKPTDEQIAKILGTKVEKATKEELRKLGKNFVKTARAKLRSDHRHILLANVEAEKSP